MQKLQNAWLYSGTKLSQLRDRSPSRIIERGCYGMAAGFYSWSTWQLAKSVMSAAASCGLNCLKNADPKVLMPLVQSSSILALKEGLSCSQQCQQILFLSALTATSGMALAYCAHKMIRRVDSRLGTPPLPPSESPRSIVHGRKPD